MPRWIYDRGTLTAQDPYARIIYQHLVMKAAYEDGYEMLPRQRVFVKRGQVATSPQTIADEIGLGFDRKFVERRLSCLESDRRIVQRVDQHGRIITIVNYDCYEENTEKMGNEMTSETGGDDQHAGNRRPHIEEAKNIKEAKNIRNSPITGARARTDPPLLARQILAKALGAVYDGGESEGGEAEAWEEIGELAAAVVLVRYRTLQAFWRAYQSRCQATPAGMVDAQFRESFEATLVDPAFDPKTVLARRRRQLVARLGSGARNGDSSPPVGDFTATMEGT